MVMYRAMVLFLAANLGGGAWAMEGQGQIPAASAVASKVPDSGQLEKQLQQLSWVQFRQVVSAVPKLKDRVDAFGPMGWEYVRANYRSYPWRKSIDRLDDVQKGQLAALIAQAQAGGTSTAGGG